jgi:hypothetical protein
MRLMPNSGLVYVSLVTPNIYLNRFDSALALAKEAQAKQLDSPVLRFLIYQLNFLQNTLQERLSRWPGLWENPAWRMSF